jgi:hypothetical protein
MFTAVYRAEGGITWYDEYDDPMRLFPLAEEQVPAGVRAAATAAAPGWWPGPAPPPAPRKGI